MILSRKLCFLLVMALAAIGGQARSLSDDRVLHFKDHHLMHSLYHSRGEDQIVVCDICPKEASISPCSCTCHNTTVADITCGESLTDCNRLTEILNVATPISQYLRLTVHQTSLKCILSKDIWGPTTFQEIILTNNQFHTMDNHAFVPFNSTLKVLNLEQNLLQNVCFSTLSDQPLIEKVLLSHNNIMFVPGEGSISLNQLKELDLHNNMLTSVQANTFSRMPRLEMLDLSNNMIESIQNHAFAFQSRASSKQALHIKLNNNRLQSIPKNMTHGVQNVTIDLRNNNLVTLPEQHFLPIFESSNFSAKILVTGNDILCNRDLCWIVQNKNITKAFDNFMCTNDTASLYDLTIDDLDCDGKTEDAH